MRRLRFLLEIGTEEIPDWMIGPALGHLKKTFEQTLGQNRLAGRVAWAEATPRRLALMAEGLPKTQKDTTESVSGPPKGAGEAAAAAFARKLGAGIEHLQLVGTVKGEYYCFTKKVPGRLTAEILAESLPGVILGIPWPKTMYWTGKGGPRFIRPIRWLVALLGANVVSFEVAGVHSGNVTTGHRRLGKMKITVSIKNYEERLRQNHVLVRAGERRRRIEDGMASLLEGTGLQVKPDGDLLETLTHLTEWPTPFLGNFDESYLSLPQEVLITVMKHHQKYFSAGRPDGSLAPCFLAVMNTDGDAEGLIRAGNERVLRARFNDARFFWDVDQHRPLAERVESLAHVTFQARLGSYLDKTKRVVELLKELKGSVSAQRAALLAKCDLTTEMVKEFTELQGIIGGLYAKAQGEADAVAEAIYDHYKPLSMEDSLPRTEDGCILSLADKLDTLRGCFAVGLVPTSSKDPFALRRAAHGVIRILAEGKLAVPFPWLAGGGAALEEFLLDRVRYYFREIRGFAYDEVNAVLAAGFEQLGDAENRLNALRQVRPTENFEPLAASFKRIRNILRQADYHGGGAVDIALLEAGPEAELHTAFVRVSGRVAHYRSAGDYRTALEVIASLRPNVDLFFDKVLVNTPDHDRRQNRLALLHGLLTEFSSIADFSEIVTSQS